MFPNQQYPPPGAPYPPQAPYNPSGVHPQQQQQQPPFGNTPSYGSGAGPAGNYPSPMSSQYGGNQGMYGGPGNPYGQGSNPQGGNPYGQSGYPPAGQPAYGANTYNQPGGGYPPQQGGGYPPQQGGYPSQQGGYPPQQGGYAPQQGGYPGGGGYMQNSQRLNQVVQQYEINPQFAARLQALAAFEIVILCDDSGSMNTPLQGSNQTRWEELKSLVNIVTDISSVMDSNGVDIYFLNRDPLLNVTNAQAVRQAFSYPPQGLTPLVPALRRILAAKRGQSLEKKLLILVATDGAPTNEHGQQDVGALEAVLRHERTPQTYITFLACTDDLASVNYLSHWDKSMPNLDVIDDYRSERAEIQRTRGANFPFSYGDYIVKSLLGSSDPWFDSLDDRM